MSAKVIWDGDLFGRQAEAEQLIGFLETVATRPSLREDGHAYVLAVDAPYGEGKSFFLRRFAKHMALSHPVAFIDAWTDDLEDEPLVALAATLEQAFSDYEDKSGELKKRIASVIDKTGRVAKIAAGGLFKRGVGLVITPKAAEAASAVIGEISEATAGSIGDAVDDVVDEASGEITKITTQSMQKRIDRFNEGRRAVEAMKQSLRDLVAYLRQDDIYPPPIVIVIDELDRCRPTYAIKLLEEVKHLFDVEGVAFVLGMHGDALAHSVSAAYGTNFNGAAYLSRFLNRRYRLREAPIYALLSALFNARSIPLHRLRGGRFVVDDREPNTDVVALISLLMKTYGLNARDVFTVVDILETCLALTDDDALIVPYLIPLIFNYIKGKTGPAQISRDQNWKYIVHGSFQTGTKEWLPADFVNRYHSVASLTVNELMREGNRGDDEFIVNSVIAVTANNDGKRLSAPRNYEILIQTVSRFIDPNSRPA